MESELEVPEFWVFPYEHGMEPRLLGEKETILDVFQSFRKECKEEDVRDERVTDNFRLLYDARTYMDRDLPSCWAFDDTVRKRAEYAPLYRGNVVVISRHPYLDSMFADACAELWAEPAPQEMPEMDSLTDAVKGLFSRVGAKPNSKLELA